MVHQVGRGLGQDAAPEVAPELLLHAVRYALAHAVGLVGQGEVGFQVFLSDAVERGGLGPPAPLGLGKEALLYIYHDINYSGDTYSIRT